MARAVALAALTVVLAAAPARADVVSGDMPNGAGSFQFQKLLINNDGDPTFTEPIDVDRDEYFNLAHCVCSKAGAGLEQNFQLDIEVLNATTPSNRPAEMWSGPNCSDDQLRPTQCKKIDSAGIADLSTLNNMIQHRVFKVSDLLAPISAGCPTEEVTGHIWVLADISGGGTFDFNLADPIDYDTLAPPSPVNATASPGENAIQVDWDAVVDRADDVAYYQALCARADTGGPALAMASNEPRYQTASQLCQLASDEVPLTAVANKPGAPALAVDAPIVDAALPDAGTPDAMPSNLPVGLQNLDPTFICGETPAPASSLRISGLENDVEYRVVVVAVDLSGNAGGIYFQNSITPKEVTDLWEDLHDRGSNVEGGFCLIAETYGGSGPLADTLRSFRDNTLADSAFGRWVTKVYYWASSWLAPIVHGSIIARVIAFVVLAPLVVLGLLWHVLTLPGLLALMLAARWLWKRRRSRVRVPSRGRARLLGVAVLFGLLALGGTASAQASEDPYWSDTAWDDDNVGEEILDPHWHVGLKVGPYIPEIDDQLGGSGTGPYEAMFGKGHAVMPVLDVDWLFWRKYGQLGIGGSVGVMWRSASAYMGGTDPNDPMRPRSPGDTTKFRLIPLAATATYRFTMLDDTYGIPVVPYLRGGLAYYIWWIRAPSGNNAVIYDPPGCDPKMDGCSANRARGASLGFQVAIGLAIRAERIDPNAARSMRQGGVEHAGFYAELSLAKVDGFGNDKKLSVGDKTWFAGVDFEF